MSSRSHTTRMDQVIVSKPDTFIGIDYHKHYSVYHVIDGEGKDLAKGRIEHHSPQDFSSLVERWPKCRVAFECSMNWHWLYEILEQSLAPAGIVLANLTKTRTIAEAQVKTDKVDARILAQLLRVDLISALHIPAKETRQRQEVLRQRCFFVRQRTMLRNRIHRLLGGQRDLKLPQVSDLFGSKGLRFLGKLELPAPAGLLLKQQLEMLIKMCSCRSRKTRLLSGKECDGVENRQAHIQGGMTGDSRQNNFAVQPFRFPLIYVQSPPAGLDMLARAPRW